MKKYLWLAPVMLLAAACKPETDNTASLSATPTEIEFAATGGAAQTIAVTAKNVAWDYSVPESTCLLYTSPSPRDAHESRMPSSA